jgi:hypothetical protein
MIGHYRNCSDEMILQITVAELLYGMHEVYV